MIWVGGTCKIDLNNICVQAKTHFYTKPYKGCAVNIKSLDCIRFSHNRHNIKLWQHFHSTISRNIIIICVFFYFSSGIKDGISRKDEIYNKLVENFFNTRSLDFPKASCEKDGSYFVQVLKCFIYQMLLEWKKIFFLIWQTWIILLISLMCWLKFRKQILRNYCQHEAMINDIKYNIYFLFNFKAVKR